MFCLSFSLLRFCILILCINYTQTSTSPTFLRTKYLRSIFYYAGWSFSASYEVNSNCKNKIWFWWKNKGKWGKDKAKLHILCFSVEELLIPRCIANFSFHNKWLPAFSNWIVFRFHVCGKVWPCYQYITVLHSGLQSPIDVLCSHLHGNSDLQQCLQLETLLFWIAGRVVFLQCHK